MAYNVVGADCGRRDRAGVGKYEGGMSLWWKGDFEREEMNVTDESEKQKCVTKLTRYVERWPKNRWICLSVGLISLVLGLYMVSFSTAHLFPNKSILDKIQLEKKPEELSTELWLIAEVRRAVAIQEKQNQLVALSLIECVVGIIIGMGALFLLAPLIMNWKDGGKEIQLVRLLLLYHGELEQQK